MDEMQKAIQELTAKNKPIDDKAQNFIVDLLKAQKSPEFIVDKLMANGYDYQASYDAVHAIYDHAVVSTQENEKKSGGTDIAIGLVILVIGIAITASGNVIAYGAIIVGAIKLIRGVSNSV